MHQIIQPFQIFVISLFLGAREWKEVAGNVHPNVVLLLVDNLGFSDLGCYGNSTVNTPNIDKLASEGIRFNRWYAEASAASTRSAVLTGLLPIRTGIIKSRHLPFKSFPSLASTGGLQQRFTTLAEILKAKRYDTGYVGHWGLGVGRGGQYLPLHHGFDYFYGTPTLHNKYCIRGYTDSSTSDEETEEYEMPAFYFLLVSMLIIAISSLAALWTFKRINFGTFSCLAAPGVVLLYFSYFSIYIVAFVKSRNCILYRNSNIIEQPYTADNLTLRFTKEAVQYINEHSHSSKAFFLMVSSFKLHQPLFLSSHFSNCSTSKLLCALSELDWSVGKIVEALDRYAAENNTLVILTSTGSNSNAWEGDIRAPAIVRWRSHLSPGQTIHTQVSCMDILPTLMELTNQSMDSLYLDGSSLWPLLSNSSAERKHDVMFHYVDLSRPAAVSYGKYKLMYAVQSADGTKVYYDPPLLFNVESDPDEMKPLSLDLKPDILPAVTSALGDHMSNRTDIWESQFDSPISPMLFPCTNLPSCTQLSKTEDDFSELFQTVDSDSVQDNDKESEMSEV